MFRGLKFYFLSQESTWWCWKYCLMIQYPSFSFISWKVNWKSAAIL
jgi:hypothetical protein